MKQWFFRRHDDGRSEALKYGLALVPPAGSGAIGVLHTGAIVIRRVRRCKSVLRLPGTRDCHGRE